MEYVDLLIHVAPGPDGHYSVSARVPDVGTADSELKLPVHLEDLAGIVHGVAETIRTAKGPGAEPLASPRGTLLKGEPAPAEGEPAPTEEEPAPAAADAPRPSVGRFGAQLFSALFSDEIRSLLDTVQGSIRDSIDTGVRIRLSMDLAAEGMRTLASLPWELIARKEHDPALVLSNRTVLVRSLNTIRPTTRAAFEPPLRILVVRSNPSGTGALNLSEEQRRIESSWALLSKVHVDFVDPVFDHLTRYLAEKDPHVVHYMGHGDFDSDAGGVLLLETEDGRPDPIGADRLRILFQDERALRLVFLNACKTGTAGSDPTLSPFAGVATAFATANVPAVVAMQFPISDDAAIAFSETFYQRIVSGDPVDKAVTEARKRLRTEWATPVLFLQSEDGRLFEETVSRRDDSEDDVDSEGEPSQPVQESDEFHVLLCAVPDDLRPHHRQIKAELEEAGIRVTADVPPPYEGEQHASAFRDAVRGADLSVHLLGDHPGEPVESEALRPYPFTYPLEQLKIGLESARAQLLLMPEHIDLQTIEDERYLAFIRSLGGLSRDPGQLELVRTGRHQMVDAILHKRDQLRREQRPAYAGGIDRACLNLHAKDLGSVETLVEHLSQRNITWIVTSEPPGDDTGAALEVFEETLEKAPLLIVVFGKVDHDWVEHRLIHAVKVATAKRLRTRIAVYVAPPEKSPDELEFPPFYDVVSGLNGFDADALDAMIQRVGRIGA